MRPAQPMPDADRPGRWDVTIVTHAALPGGAPDDLILGDALRARGLAIRFAAWNDSRVDWSASVATVVRSAWDYHQTPAAWRAWVATTGVLTRLLNPPDVLLWNTDKRYLRTLTESGISCVPTAFVEAGSYPPLAEVASPWGWTDVVVKPAISASAVGARRFTGASIEAEGGAHLRQLTNRGVAMVQPYMAVVETTLERSLVFCGGVFSHAFSKTAFNKNAIGKSAISPHGASSAELAAADAALACAPARTAYARVDLLPDDGGPLVLELELIEPDLGLRLCPESTRLLVEYLIRSGG